MIPRDLGLVAYLMLRRDLDRAAREAGVMAEAELLFARFQVARWFSDPAPIGPLWSRPA